MKFKKIIISTIVLSFLSVSSAFSETNNKECFEKLSRGIFKFNQGVDKIIISPIAKGYNKLPEPIKNGTGNFTSNLATLLSVPNHILQGEWKAAGDSTASFLINSTVGILGFANPAKKLGLENRQEDVGQTLGRYGVGEGCYFVLPILGPTTLRDTAGKVADMFVDPFAQVTLREKEILSIQGTKMDFYTVKGADAIDFRADNDKNLENLEKNSLDMYAAMKSLYLQNRTKRINNSATSEDDEWSEFNK